MIAVAYHVYQIRSIPTSGYEQYLLAFMALYHPRQLSNCMIVSRLGYIYVADATFRAKSGNRAG